MLSNQAILEYQAIFKKIYGKEIDIDSKECNTCVEFDGDIRGYLPAKIEVVPKALGVIIS